MIAIVALHDHTLGLHLGADRQGSMLWAGALAIEAMLLMFIVGRRTAVHPHHCCLEQNEAIARANFS
jgi:hypothetical protein